MLSVANKPIVLSVVNAKCRYAECHYAECLNKPIMLSVVMLSVIMLNVAAPFLLHRDALFY